MSGHEKSRAVVLAALMVLSVFATGIAFTGTAAAEDLDQCRTIDSSGTYNLTDNISVSQESGDCIEITSSNVTFNGNGNEIVDTSSQPDENVDDNAAIRVNSGDGSELTNVTVRNVNVEQFNDGVRYDNVNNSTVTDVTAKFNAEGISVTDSSDVEISDNSLEGNKVNDGGGGAGIGLVDSTESEVTGNTLGNDNLGIFVSGSENNTIADNEINETTGSDGIGLYSASQNNTIEDNTVTNAFDNGIILFDGSDNNAILGNDLANNTDDGLNLNDASGNEVRNNTIQDNDRSGLTLNEDDFGDDDNQAPESGSDDGSNNNLITDNIITGNSRGGIGLAGNNMENLIYDNFLRQVDDNTSSDNVIFAGGAANTSNQYNVEPREETNIIGGQYTAGNYYANPGDAQGYSEQCADDSERFGICDESNDLDDDAGTEEDIDQYPITESGEIGEIEISPDTVDFGDVETDETATQDVNISNVGNDTISANATGISGDDASAFSIVSEDTNTTLAPGESFEVSVEFAPDDQADDQTANLTVTSNDSTEPSTDVQLTGDGLPAGQGDVDAPFRQQFGSVDVGNSTSETFFLENDGTDPVEVNETTIEGANDSDFEITEGGADENNTYTIDEGETRAVTIEFAPDSTGDKEAMLTVGTVDDDTETTKLTGTGEEEQPPAQGDLTAQSDADFGNVDVGNSSTETVTYTNDGDAPVNVTDFSFSGDDPDAFSTDNDGFTLDAGESTDVDVTFSPSSAGDKSATITADTENDGSATTQLSGTGNEGQPPGDHTITFVGTGNTSEYVFSVTDDLQKSTANDANKNSNDEVRRGYVGDGEVDISNDSYTYNGTLETIDVNGDAEVYVDGEQLSEEDITNMRNNVIEIEGTGSEAGYDFAATDASNERIQKVTANNANLNNEDEIFRTTGYGSVSVSKDAYGFNGVIDSLEVDGNANVYVNGEQVDPATEQDNTITIVGTGDTAEYEFTVESSLAPSNANYANTNSDDVINGDTKTGTVSISADSNDYSGDITSFSADGNVQVYVDGELIDQNDVADKA